MFWNIQVLLLVTFREKKKNRGKNMAEEPDMTSKQRQNIWSFELKGFISSWKYY